MIKNILPLLGIFLIFGVGGCNNSSPNKQLINNDTLVEDLSLCRDGVIEYEIKTIRAIGTDTKNKKKIISEVHLKYPQLHSKNSLLSNAVQGYVNAFIEGQLKDNMNAEDTAKAKTITSASKAFIESCKSKIEDAKKGNPEIDQVWYCDIIGNVEMQSGTYFTLRFQYTNYTGGAHGNYGEEYATFDIKTGKKLTWADVLINDKKFMTLAELRFKQVNGLATSKPLSEEDGFSFQNNQFSLSDNFGLTNDGLIMYYQPYQVAPFSFGATKILFKYFEVLDYLNPKLFGEPM